jgi:hypothetical protein
MPASLESPKDQMRFDHRTMPAVRDDLGARRSGEARDLYFMSVAAARRVRMVVSNGD